jgi:hypothetical protein
MWTWLRKFFMPKKILQGEPFTAQIDGEDIVFSGWATAFGDAKDVASGADNGQTACGITLSKHPDLMGVALPAKGYGVKSLGKSPLPKMPFGMNSKAQDLPFGAHVVLEDPKTGKKSPSVPFIELGPSGFTGNVVDLTVPLARLFDSKANGVNFKRKMNVRILGGAKWVVA